MKLKLQKQQYIKNASTDKAYAIDFSKYGEPSMIFLPKKLTTLTEDVVVKDGVYWTTNWNVEFPDWLYTKMTDNQKISIKLMLEQWEEEDLEPSYKVYQSDAWVEAQINANETEEKHEN